jgi:hypothetical protein
MNDFHDLQSLPCILSWYTISVYVNLSTKFVILLSNKPIDSTTPSIFSTKEESSPIVGDEVGWPVGRAVGWLVGLNVGPLGLLVGCPVGSADG